MKIICVAGARPNFVKIAPLLKEMKKHSEIQSVLVHTGQHYDVNMSDVFFKDLEIPAPDYNLGVGSGSHSEQTAKIMIEFEKICLKEKPDLVLVVGDVNSTIACALVAKKMQIKVAHVEAGLRSFDMSMPEEINRILTDTISDYLFVSEESGIQNLEKEGINENKIFFVGNVMIDSLLNNYPKIQKSEILRKLKLEEKKYAVLTLHRPNNVDNKEILSKLLDCFDKIPKQVKLVWPVHPRTRNNLEQFGFKSRIDSMKNVLITEPLSYLNFLSLISRAAFVLTDSGGIQEETTFLKIPCITLRENTERPSTITIGSNVLVGNDEKAVLKHINNILEGAKKDSRIPQYWDGHTAERIIRRLLEQMKS